MPGTSAHIGEFKASKGWFERFKNRSDIHSVIRHVLEENTKQDLQYSGGKGTPRTQCLISHCCIFNKESSRTSIMSEKTESEVVTTTPWQCKLSTPEERLASLYQTSKFTDLTITFPGHEETMKVLYFYHWYIL
nr:uncharacterized protein LOC128700064 [Cherax quadricarinatus]